MCPRPHATISSSNRPPAKPRHRAGSKPRPQAEGKWLGPDGRRDESRTAVVKQLAQAPALLDLERLESSGAGGLLRHGVHCPGQLATVPPSGRRFNPKRPIRLPDQPIYSGVTPANLALWCRGGQHGHLSPPAAGK
jgi:hypothetical protein